MIGRRVHSLVRRSLCLAMIFIAAAGCTRQFFRNRADRDVENLLEEKSQFEPDMVRGWYVYPDRRSRFADFDRRMDRPRKPPDDPAVAALTPDPQPLRTHLHSGPDTEGQGYMEFLRYCDQENRARRTLLEADTPSARLGDPTRVGTYEGSTEPVDKAPTSFELALKSDEPRYLINLEQALELSLFNSRDYQDRREDLYISALPVTLQRFNLATQLFAGTTAIRSWTGRDVPGGPGTAWNLNSTGVATQLFPTGASVVAQFANRLVIDLGSSNPTVGISDLSLQVLQPLLQGGGWAIALEPLTQSERNLVYAVRSYSRFRLNFYVYIAGGGDLFNSQFAYTGLNLRGVGPTLAVSAQGYLPTLLTTALERNERSNIRTLNDYLALYREYQGRGDFSELQVGQVEQQILRSQLALLGRQKELQDNLDQFKLQLGLPTRTPIELEDTPTKPITSILEEYTRAQEEFQSLRNEADLIRNRYRLPLQALAGVAVGNTRIPLGLPTIRELADRMVFDSSVTKATKEFRATIGRRWERWRQMPPQRLQAELKELTEEWRRLQIEEATLQAAGQPFPPEREARMDFLPRDIAVGQLEFSLREYEAAWDNRPGATRSPTVLFEAVVNDFIRVMSEAREERRKLLRESWPKVPEVMVDGTDLLTEDLDRAYTVVAQTALAYRPELMNARGLMVDAWRRIGVNANSLLGVLNVGYNLNAVTPGGANEPLALGGSRSRHQLILTGELPLVRRAERNEYRVSLIAYQRARRNLQATEDFILNQVRTDLRGLRLVAENYKIQQRAVEVAFDQVENSLDVLQSPPVPDGAAVGQPGRAAAQGQQQAANAASLTQQLLQAQTSFLQAQNGIYQAWVNYLIARMTLYRDLERLPLDDRGAWIDEHSHRNAAGSQADPRRGPVQHPQTGWFAELQCGPDR